MYLGLVHMAFQPLVANWALFSEFDMFTTPAAPATGSSHMCVHNMHNELAPCTCICGTCSASAGAVTVSCSWRCLSFTAEGIDQQLMQQQCMIDVAAASGTVHAATLQFGLGALLPRSFKNEHLMCAHQIGGQHA